LTEAVFDDDRVEFFAYDDLWRLRAVYALVGTHTHPVYSEDRWAEDKKQMKACGADWDWFEEELARMRTLRYLWTRVPETPIPLPRLSEWPRLPPEYAEFVARFGLTKIIRETALSYSLHVFREPRKVIEAKGMTLVLCGVTASGYICFRMEGTSGVCRPTVHLWREDGACVDTGESFTVWFAREFLRLKRKIGIRRWRTLCAGPAPLTEEEATVVDARKRFEWRVIDSTTPGCPRIRITNRSERRLPFVTVYFNAIVPEVFLGHVYSGLMLPVAHLAPGESDEFTRSLVWGDRVSYSGAVEFFDPPHWGPEERDYLWEFRTLPPEYSSSELSGGR